jgi:hypothetical protein
MTAVAGDFYEFIPVDQHRVGFLVADVSGHGVPAALIAAMIKVAMQSLVRCAHQPREVLRGLNRILSGQLRAQLVSAAYLWFDMELGRGGNYASFSSSRMSQAFASFQSRMTVCGETSRTSAVSSMLSPQKSATQRRELF